VSENGVRISARDVPRRGRRRDSFERLDESIVIDHPMDECWGCFCSMMECLCDARAVLNLFIYPFFHCRISSEKTTPIAAEPNFSLSCFV
jgi:hypothetical protein